MSGSIARASEPAAAGRDEGEDSAAVAAALRLGLSRLSAWRHAGGYYEGFTDSGVAFDAANVLLERFVGDGWPDDPARMTAKMRHVLSGQHACGLFRLYPGGPCSVEATRIARLCVERVLEACGSTLPAAFRDELSRARRRADEAISDPRCAHFELVYILLFRMSLQALDDSAPDPPRRLPSPRLLLLLPIMLAGLLPAGMWRRVDRILYPFIAVLPQLLGLSAWRAVEDSRAGGALLRAVDRLPGVLGRVRSNLGGRAARWLLERQDATGGFYYSPVYTYLFVAALRNAADVAASPSLDTRAQAAVRRALDYVRERETVVPTGVSSSFLASDVWDSTAVATGELEAPPGLAPTGPSPGELAAYVAAQQSPSGGFSYGRGSHFPDVDSTGLAMGLFAAVIGREPSAARRATLLGALVRAFDFLERHRSAAGGFNAWTVRHGEAPPPMPSELASVLFDVSSADVTARVMSSLARVAELARADAGAASALGPERLRRLERLRDRGLAYLRSTRDRSTGLWPARWTLGYVVGTRFVFDALETYPEATPELDELRRAAARTLVTCQNPDGGFGESPDSDTKGRFTPSPSSASLVTAAALGILRGCSERGAREGAARALAFLLRAQRPDGSWPEASLYTQFAGLYASYELMTQVGVTTTLSRILRATAAPSASGVGVYRGVDPSRR